MGPTEYCTMILLPKPSQKLLCVSLLEPGIPDYRLLSVFSKRKFFLTDVGNSVKDDSSDHIRRAFPVALISIIRGLTVAVLPWMLDL
jgi:hypothetical protein